MFRSTLLGCALNLACVIARPSRAPEVVSAREFLHANWNTAELAQSRFLGQRVVVTGLVERQQGKKLLLQTDERGFFVRCWLRSEVDSLQRGQLVAFAGIVSSVDKDSPTLRDCELSWLGDRPGDQPDARQTIIAAASSALCAAADRERELATTNLPASHPIARQERELTEHLERQAHASLGGTTPLACEHPLVSLARSCPWPAMRFDESGAKGDLERGSECSTAQVKAVLERLHLKAR